MAMDGPTGKAAWFEIWAQAGCCWDSVRAREDFQRVERTDNMSANAWLTRDQLTDHYKNPVVSQAIIAKKESAGDWKPHPEVPECREGILYQVRLSEREVKLLRKQYGQHLEIEADMDDEAGTRLARTMASDHPSSSLARSASNDHSQHLPAHGSSSPRQPKTATQFKQEIGEQENNAAASAAAAATAAAQAKENEKVKREAAAEIARKKAEKQEAAKKQRQEATKCPPHRRRHGCPE